jgi:hypothetical protein
VSREKPQSQGGLQLQTLLISAVSAVAAATVVPLFWQKGTIIATAMTPVIVALVSEGLRRPAQRISQAAPRVARRTATGAAIRRFEPDAARTRHSERLGARGAGPERFEPLPPDERDSGAGTAAEDPFGLRRPARSRRSWWKAGIATGAVAFVIAAVVVTGSELAIFGGSISGGNERTSLFGGSKHKSASDTNAKDEKTSPNATPTATASPAQQQATPTATATPPSATATPSATASPQTAQPTATAGP